MNKIIQLLAPCVVGHVLWNRVSLSLLVLRESTSRHIIQRGHAVSLSLAEPYSNFILVLIFDDDRELLLTLCMRWTWRIGGDDEGKNHKNTINVSGGGGGAGEDKHN